ncbi:uncharacterized protein [Rutidosis leptorrhynchoides]|uniref:uncharacterized protein isoform X2 n=1 Tax=Rutidosis leptorrhynchoides TaxID=125765 RepID=UPI003A98E168
MHDDIMSDNVVDCHNHTCRNTFSSYTIGLGPVPVGDSDPVTNATVLVDGLKDVSVEQMIEYPLEYRHCMSSALIHDSCVIIVSAKLSEHVVKCHGRVCFSSTARGARGIGFITSFYAYVAASAPNSNAIPGCISDMPRDDPITCEGKIYKTEDQRIWCYNACKMCKRKVKISDTEYAASNMTNKKITTCTTYQIEIH